MLSCMLYYLCVGAVVLLVVDDGRREREAEGKGENRRRRKVNGGRGEGMGGMLPWRDMFRAPGKMILYHNNKILVS